jgi:hypothetical protein
MSTTLCARLGASFFSIWGAFHSYVARQICTLSLMQNGIASPRPTASGGLAATERPPSAIRWPVFAAYTQLDRSV